MEDINTVLVNKRAWKNRRQADSIRSRRRIERRYTDIEYKAFMLAVCLLGYLVLMCVFCKGCHAENVNIDLYIIADIESNMNPLAYNDSTQATGEFQITPIVLRAFNANHPETTHYIMDDMFNKMCAADVSNWYLNNEIPMYLQAENVPDSITSRLIAYNWGIGHLHKWYKQGSHWNRLPRETRNYIKKYYEELDEMKGDD